MARRQKLLLLQPLPLLHQHQHLPLLPLWLKPHLALPPLLAPLPLLPVPWTPPRALPTLLPQPSRSPDRIAPLAQAKKCHREVAFFCLLTANGSESDSDPVRTQRRISHRDARGVAIDRQGERRARQVWPVVLLAQVGRRYCGQACVVQ